MWLCHCRVDIDEIFECVAESCVVNAFFTNDFSHLTFQIHSKNLTLNR